MKKKTFFTVIIQDSYGDGIYIPGGYGLYLNGALVFNGYNLKNSWTDAIPSNFNFFMLKLKTDKCGGEPLWELKKGGSKVLNKKQYTYHSMEIYE